MTKYIVWRPDYGQTMEDGREIEALCADYAAQDWAQRDDCESADYLIVGGNPAELMALEVGSTMPPLRFSVSGESVAVYRAVPMKEES